MSRGRKSSPASTRQLSMLELFAAVPEAAAPPRALPDDGARRIAATALDRSLLVEAGAGTGKTTLIVQRIAALVESGVPISRIVAITFTEKAAGELKLRVRQELERVSSEASKRALAELEHASISTIHAWCARLLREYPVEAGVDPLFSVLDEPGRETLFARAWEQWLGTALSGAQPAPVEDVPGLTADWWLRNLRALALVLVRHRHRLPDALPAETGVDPLPALETALGALPRLRALAVHCREPGDRMLAAIANLESAAASFRSAPLDRRPAVVLATTDFPPSYKSVGAKGNWKGPTDVLGEARRIADEIVRGWREARAVLEHDAAARAARWLATSFLPAYEAEKRRVGAVDFDDLLVLARNLLRDRPEVRRRVRRNVRQLILDEFQDTDPVQCEAAFLLTSLADDGDWRKAEPAPGRLFLVGDPKQSIYAFRGADIETYLTARERLDAAASVVAISTNFRSRRGVLDWVNATFGALIQADGHVQPAYAPLEVFHDGDPEGSGVHVLRPPPDASYDTLEQSRDAEARAVAALLRDRMRGGWIVRDKKDGAERPAKYGDVVLLLRNRMSSLTAFETAFRAGGIPYVVVGGRALWERLEVRALAALCAAVENPFDAVSVVAALKSPFFGASDADLLLWRHRHGGFAFHATTPADGVVGQALRRMREWHRDRLEVPPERLLQRILAETGAIAAFGMKPDGAQRVANLMRLLDASRGAGDAFGMAGAPPSFRAWVQWLQERVKSTREDAEGAVLEEEGDAVRILTMHAAKGLEFPIVILGDLAAREQNAEPFHVHPESGRLAFRLGSKELGLATEGFEEARAAQERRAAAEELRLLYVAATRAKDALVVPLFPSRQRTGRGAFLGTLTDAFPALLDRELAHSIPEGEGGPARIVDDELVPIAGAPPVFRVPTDLLASALAPLPVAADGGAPHADADADGLRTRVGERARARAVAPVTRVVHLDDALPASRTVSWTGEEAAALGTAVHRALEIMDLGDADGVARAAAAEARAAGLSAPLVDRAEALARAAAALPSIDRARRSPRLLREWPFALRDGDGDGGDAFVLEGVIDLAWVEGRELVVLDYKTDAVTTDAEVTRAADHHLPQLLAYAWALSRVTQRPVREVVLAFLAPGREVVHAVSPSDLDAAAARVRAGFGSLFPARTRG